MILAILRVLALSHPLVHGVLETREPPPPTIALVHALHAERAATPAARERGVTPELLLAIAYKESRYQPKSRPQCGVTQIAARKNPKRCRRLVADTQYAYDEAVLHLEAWLDFRYCRGRGIACALTGYGKGTKAARGKPSGYALRTLQLATRIRGDAE